MTRGHFKVFTIVVFLLAAAGIGALVLLPGKFFSTAAKETPQTRVVIPRIAGAGGEAPAEDGRDEDGSLRVRLEEDETAAAVLTRDFNGDSFDDQVAAYRKIQEIDSPIYITYAEFDVRDGKYHRKWSAPAAAARPGTLFLYSEDLIGDGGICVLVSGMNGAGEQTLTVFRKTAALEEEPFSKIAELLIEGSIAVEEPARNNPGRSLSIATYSRDYESANVMDQIEVTYAFNQVNGLYEQARTVKVPGTQIEQRKLRELLDGGSARFEEFINGLWYQGEGANRKYVYFNTAARELIFYDNNSEEVFSWQDSAPTRYGLHINSKNVSLSKLRRTINVELASLESIRLRVFQDLYLRSGPNTIWDGSYRRPESSRTAENSKKTVPYVNAVYTGPDGFLSFSADGSYTMDPLKGPSELSRRGQYVFFTAAGEELLELRPAETAHNGEDPRENARHETFRVNRNDDRTISLTRVRISTRGIQNMFEPPIRLSPRG